jgi:hypothetical protein
MLTAVDSLCVLSDRRYRIRSAQSLVLRLCLWNAYPISLCSLRFCILVSGGFLIESIKLQRQVYILLRFFASPKKVAKKGEIYPDSYRDRLNAASRTFRAAPAFRSGHRASRGTFTVFVLLNKISA